MPQFLPRYENVDDCVETLQYDLVMCGLSAFHISLGISLSIF